MFNQHLPLLAPAPEGMVSGYLCFHQKHLFSSSLLQKLPGTVSRGLGLHMGAPEAGAEFQRSRDKQIFSLLRIVLPLQI